MLPRPQTPHNDSTVIVLDEDFGGLDGKEKEKLSNKQEGVSKGGGNLSHNTDIYLLEYSITCYA